MKTTAIVASVFFVGAGAWAVMPQKAATQATTQQATGGCILTVNSLPPLGGAVCLDRGEKWGATGITSSPWGDAWVEYTNTGTMQHLKISIGGNISRLPRIITYDGPTGSALMANGLPSDLPGFPQSVTVQ